MNSISCAVCARQMSYAGDNPTWVQAPDDAGVDMHACSSVCALRLGYTMAMLTCGGTTAKVEPPPCQSVGLMN